MTVTTPQPTTTTLAPPPSPREDADWLELTEAVREAGEYPTRSEAERVTRAVLTALGAQVSGDERVALAQALPSEAGRLVASRIPSLHALTAREFVDAAATDIEDSTPATARWHVSSVLSVLPSRLGEPLTADLLSQLPPGYALLFGRADLAAAA
ncbi:DUF2267 domain-containing protein [Streptomyces sp. NPDC015171]|uniref:DUF2267 domain-containing protein n=1 Tax=Streptomyces sp. NPDC015171 TaxID=3364945 RepID=UPI0036FEF569